MLALPSTFLRRPWHLEHGAMQSLFRRQRGNLEVSILPARRAVWLKMAANGGTREPVDRPELCPEKTSGGCQDTCRENRQASSAHDRRSLHRCGCKYIESAAHTHSATSIINAAKKASEAFTISIGSLLLLLLGRRSSLPEQQQSTVSSVRRLVPP